MPSLELCCVEVLCVLTNKAGRLTFAYLLRGGNTGLIKLGQRDMRAASSFLGLLSGRRAVRLLPLTVRPLGASLSTAASGGRGRRGSKGGKETEDARAARRDQKAAREHEEARDLANLASAWCLVTASGFPPPPAACDADADCDDDDDDLPVERPSKRRRQKSRSEARRSSLMRKTANTLEQMCVDAGLPSKGSKAQMVEHLLTQQPPPARPARLTPG